MRVLCACTQELVMHALPLRCKQTPEPLHFCWLQNNCIGKLEGLSNLAKLQKLYLEDNQISMVEGLDNCASLQELHLSRQCLPAGVSLDFDPNSLEVCLFMPHSLVMHSQQDAACMLQVPIDQPLRLHLSWTDLHCRACT